jgi:hypothetical protein
MRLAMALMGRVGLHYYFQLVECMTIDMMNELVLSFTVSMNGETERPAS